MIRLSSKEEWLSESISNFEARGQMPEYKEWKSLDSDPKYFIKYWTSEAGYSLMLTDLIHVWNENIENEQMDRKVELVNELFELSKSDLLKIIADALAELKDLTLKLSENNEHLEIELSKKLAIVKFKYKFELQRMDYEECSKTIFNEFIKPLVNFSVEAKKRLSDSKRDLELLNNENNLLTDKLASCGQFHKRMEFKLDIDFLNTFDHHQKEIIGLDLWKKREVIQTEFVEPLGKPSVTGKDVKNSAELELEKRKQLDEKLAQEPEKKKKKRIL